LDPGNAICLDHDVVASRVLPRNSWCVNWEFPIPFANESLMEYESKGAMFCLGPTNRESAYFSFVLRATTAVVVLHKSRGICAGLKSLRELINPCNYFYFLGCDNGSLAS